MSNCFCYVLVVSPIAQTNRLLDFLVGLLTGSSRARYWSLTQPLRIFHAGIFRAHILAPGFTRLTRLTFASGPFGFFFSDFQALLTNFTRLTRLFAVWLAQNAP